MAGDKLSLTNSRGCSSPPARMLSTSTSETAPVPPSRRVRFWHISDHSEATYFILSIPPHRGFAGGCYPPREPSHWHENGGRGQGPLGSQVSYSLCKGAAIATASLLTAQRRGMTRAWLWGQIRATRSRGSRRSRERLRQPRARLSFHSWAFLLTNEVLEMGLINRIKSLRPLPNLRVRRTLKWLVLVLALGFCQTLLVYV
jgi:hypothetical protein